ncbi:chemotaxis protein CheB [Pseudopedobacter beijingensis]|uniref:protein-glutamate methylesterase n=1 Tax=Pseudopedobacter beijingensis TaxID=1207056 RepID=A0ABW4IBD8_9SPHI
MQKIHRIDLLLIGGSAGSLKVILDVLPELKPLSFPIIIILHRKPLQHSVLQDLLSAHTPIPVIEVEDKTMLEPGTIYIAPSDYHLLIEKNKMVTLDYSEKINHSRPSIDICFMSAADIYKNKTCAILLSGANSDGVDGLKLIKLNNGIAIAQSPETAEVSFMPKQAIEKVAIDYILRPEEIADFINSLNDY